MTTYEVANRYYELACQSKWQELQEELHDDNVIGVEPEHVAAKGIQVVTKGKESMIAKGAARRTTMETLHSQYCSEPMVAGDFFSVVLKRDITFKNKTRILMEEICIIQVNQGKIISEQYFY